MTDIENMEPTMEEGVTPEDAAVKEKSSETEAQMETEEVVDLVTEEIEETAENTTTEDTTTEDTTTEDTYSEESAEEEAETLADETEVEESQEETSSNQVAAISENLVELTNKVEEMNKLFLQKIAHTTHEEQIVDQMHAELQKYKQDMYAQIVRPILMDIIEMRDSILRVSANFASKPENEQNVPLQTFSGYAFDAQDILERYNITIYNSKEGDEFNALKQRVVKKATTPVEELHGKIAESLSSGYDYLGKTISPEKVVVYVYEKPVNAEGESNNG